MLKQKGTASNQRTGSNQRTASNLPALIGSICIYILQYNAGGGVIAIIVVLWRVLVPFLYLIECIILLNISILVITVLNIL